MMAAEDYFDFDPCMDWYNDDGWHQPWDIPRTRIRWVNLPEGTYCAHSTHDAKLFQCPSLGEATAWLPSEYVREKDDRWQCADFLDVKWDSPLSDFADLGPLCTFCGHQMRLQTIRDDDSEIWLTYIQEYVCTSCEAVINKKKVEELGLI